MTAAGQATRAGHSPLIHFPEIVSLGDAPRLHGRLRGDQPAFSFEGRQTNWAEFDRHTARVAGALAASGVGKGHRIAYLGKNSDRYFELLFGAFRVGAVMVPINWRLAAPEIVEILADSAAKILFVDETGAALADLTDDRPVYAIAPVEGVADYEGWRDAGSEIEVVVPVAADDPCIQLYTSGTTARPKGVVLPHRALYAFNEHAAAYPDQFGEDFAWISWSADDIALVALPIFHISGSGWGMIAAYAGAHTVVLDEFTNEGVIDAIRQFRVSKTVLVPATIQAITDYPGLRREDFASMRYFMYGAAPISAELLERAVAAFGCAFVQMYGLTETCGGVSCLPPADHVVGSPRMRSAGKPLPGVSVKILDPESARVLGPGAVGEICLKTPAIMCGYWQQAAETARILDADGWFRSGDAGYLDADGYLFITDRIKDMIVTGGENVYPAEVEAALALHPQVREVAVIGVPDPKWGEAVKAIVVPIGGATPDPADLIAWVRARIAGYKLPKSIDFIDALPRNATGKVTKNSLRDRYWAGRDRNVN
ncbi:long-chain-fatty-acid--CoA ligase [Hephaestia sp. GCM10023244]|uniref:long-chain-fatty-acid--CoA ligase n=1 Tax=unclassified Hephaestia TaxID=2631281 RepID=UPI00207760C7|nr:long-chain-fatty-acid--CoA ligase [Hephaestia sp. MAHUQ-44]MCM8729807.1 long-chain-fatty-acid--CoA ligase [Hephaestia sp. MAHUQ-44]